MCRLLFVEFFLISLLILTGGSIANSGEHKHNGNDGATLTGTAWILTALPGQEFGPGPRVVLRFETDSTLNGYDGCNRYQGNFSVNSSALRIPNGIATTRMACPNPVMSRASAYAEALGRVASFALAGNRLSLRDDAGNVVASFQAANRNLAGSSWYVLAYNNAKQAVVSLLGDTHITMHFGKDGRMIGYTGCNKYFTTYKTADTSVTIAQPESTRSFCARPKGVMDQEARFLELLRSVATFRLEGNRLHLRTVDGAMAMTLVRATTAPSAG